MVKCPICSTQLSPIERQGVEFLSCPEGHGAWLDQGKLEKILGKPTAKSARTSLAETAKGAFPEPVESEFFRRRKRSLFLGDLLDTD